MYLVVELTDYDDDAARSVVRGMLAESDDDMTLETVTGRHTASVRVVGELHHSIIKRVQKI